MLQGRRSHLRLVACLALLSPAACGESGDPSGPDPRDGIASVTVTPQVATVPVGATVQILVTVMNGWGESLHTSVDWTSSDPAVATVDDNGLVTGVSEGTTTITASAGGHSGSSTVTVVR